MQTTEISLLVLLAVAFVIYRQFRTRPAGRLGVLCTAGAMIVAGVVMGGLLDPVHPALSLALFAVEAFGAVALGVWRAATARVWLDDSGVAWARGTGWTLVAWVASIAVRLGLYAAGQWLGLAPSAGGILLFVGLTIGVQAYLVARRGRALISMDGRPDTVER
ncbi:hypothetical protein E1286_22070 [Nonomuraea terrae]|uniref:DUF1453 domain-containing protein n=1 Tax=Nonomuraea terrae TaxID=2530383 RepID=A0A4R4YM57_9ACTN|nr:hypothetical protein [Nonomuraea terrae]TDD46091.1 hypothetical protein E1286_22070 [Nonomuraea terrae]